MGMVKKRLHVRGDRGERVVDVLFDTGATRSLIKREVAASVSSTRKIIAPTYATLADGRRVTLETVCEVLVDIDDREVWVEAFLLDELTVEMIFGVLDMEAYMIKIDPARKDLDLSEFRTDFLALTTI
ncbi:hypothetical protein HRbin02_01373 [Candidatus Calditenuaceae archaeon HR02]|nr:hypothetical protein HRbin02_01373 [Candidatus Calditenuaceae archaeon HR02]